MTSLTKNMNKTGTTMQALQVCLSSSLSIHCSLSDFLLRHCLLREPIHGFHLLQMIFKPSGPTFSIYHSAKSLHPQSRGDLIKGGRQTVRAGQKQQWPPPPSAPWHLCYAHTLTPILFVMVQRFQHNPALCAMAYISPKSQSDRHFNELSVTTNYLNPISTHKAKTYCNLNASRLKYSWRLTLKFL